MSKDKKQDKPEPGKIYSLTGAPGVPCIANGNTWAESEYKEKPKRKSGNEVLANSLGFELSDFSDDGADLDDLRDMMEGY